jgi:hypothetical protein
MSHDDDSEAEPSASNTGAHRGGGRGGTRRGSRAEIIGRGLGIAVIVLGACTSCAAGSRGGPVSRAAYVWPAAVGAPVPGAKFYAADCSQVAADITFLQEALASTDDGIAVTDWETEMSVSIPSMERGYVTGTTEPLAIIIRAGKAITSGSDSLAPLTIANAAMSEVRHECGAAANVGNSGEATAADGDSSDNAPGDESGAESSGGTATPSLPAAVPSQNSPSAPSLSPSAAPVQPGQLTITCKVISGGALLHASQPLNNTPIVLEFSSGWEGVVTAGSGGDSTFVPETAVTSASSCKATPDTGDSD